MQRLQCLVDVEIFEGPYSNETLDRAPECSILHAAVDRMDVGGMYMLALSPRGAVQYEAEWFCVLPDVADAGDAPEIADVDRVAADVVMGGGSSALDLDEQLSEMVLGGLDLLASGSEKKRVTVVRPSTDDSLGVSKGVSLDVAEHILGDVLKRTSF